MPKQDNIITLFDVAKGYKKGSMEYEICCDFLQYLDDKSFSHIISNGFDADGIPVDHDFGYPHRYTGAYVAGRHAKMYLLDEWYQDRRYLPVTHLTMTVRHSIIPSRTDFSDTFRQLQDGKRMFMKRLASIQKGVNYMMIVEPDPNTGYPHYHMIIFRSFSFDEQIMFRKLWEAGGYGSFEHGLEFDERPTETIRSLRNYLMKYMSKSFPDYESKFGTEPWTKETLLFNAVAWRDGFRTWHASNELSRVMKYTKNVSPEGTEWEDVVLEDGAGEIRTLWNNTGDNKEVEIPEDISPEFESTDAKNLWELFSSDLMPFDLRDDTDKSDNETRSDSGLKRKPMFELNRLNEFGVIT